jgi:hypothetical protein
MSTSPRSTSLLRGARVVCWPGIVCLLALGCLPGEGGSLGFPVEPEPVGTSSSALVGDNLGGTNLGGANLGGANLGGTNLGGVNLGGTNLGGTNLGGTNLGGTNLGGNNLGGTNLGGTNLGGTNLGGTNLGGTNLGGTNLGGTNLGGTNLGGTNLAGNNLGGTNLGGTNLGGTNSGRNIHALTGSINGMLYSAEDLWTPKTAQCVVMGIGSTAFPKLLGQQSVNAKISVALGRLPWGFASSSGGAVNLQAWEAVVWGDKTYCVFVLGAAPATSWPAVAGFIKAVFRWNAPPSQELEISGIEASKDHDPTLRTEILRYPGMMDAAAKWRAGTITNTAFVGGELAFISATTNNTSVMVDFSSWILDKNNNSLVLGNVTSSPPPTYAEALYIALDNGDGTVSIMLDDAGSRAAVMPDKVANSVVDLNTAYLAWQAGLGPKPVPRRCGGALYLKTWFNEPVEAGKCDDGLAWAPGFCVKNAEPWSKIAGMVAPMNSYMQLSRAGGGYQRGLIAGSSCGPMKTVLSETYVHMWEPNFDIPMAGTCTPESLTSFCARRGKNCGVVSGTDNCGAYRSVTCGTCTSPQTCGGSGAPNVCGSVNSLIYEAEALGNTLGGSTYVHACPEAYIKILGNVDPPVTAGACAGGARLRYLGGSSSNYITFNNVNVPTAGTYAVTIYAGTRDVRTFYVSVNGASAVTVNMDGDDFGTMVSVTKNLTLRAGSNTLKFYNNSAPTPDLDRIKVTLAGSATCTAESNTEFCTRQGRNCGSLTAVDNCGTTRTVSNCGSCASPQTCGGGGEPNVCGGGQPTTTTCGTSYAQANCLSFTVGTVVASGGRNWTCTSGNCMNCATYTGCAPGGTDCPFGVVWKDGGACGGSTGGGGSTTTCASAFVKSNCPYYGAGTKVSRNGRNWTCAKGDCANCGGHTTCEPGATGCPWGTVWTDSGTCN